MGEFIFLTLERLPSLPLLLRDVDQVAHGDVHVDQVQAPIVQPLALCVNVARYCIRTRILSIAMGCHGQIGKSIVIDTFCR